MTECELGLLWGWLGLRTSGYAFVLCVLLQWCRLSAVPTCCCGFMRCGGCFAPKGLPQMAQRLARDLPETDHIHTYILTVTVTCSSHLCAGFEPVFGVAGTRRRVAACLTVSIAYCSIYMFCPHEGGLRKRVELVQVPVLQCWGLDQVPTWGLDHHQRSCNS